MRLSISAGLACFIILILASTLPSVSAGREDGDAEFRMRVERMLSDHDAQLRQNDQFHSEIRESRAAERLARVEESQAINTKLQFAILISVLGLLIRDLVSVMRRQKQ